MKRTFIAIKTDPGEKIKDCISHGRNCLKGERIKWVSPTKMHITLAFLGDTSMDRIKNTGQMLKRIVPVYDAPFIQYRGLGLFRNINDPRVVWIGLDIDPVILKMKAELDMELKNLGFRIDRRDFRPHLTLARIKGMHNKAALKDLLHSYKDYFFQESTIRNLIYYESVLGREGPTYKVIESIGFKYASP